MQQDNQQHALATYVSDILTLERHIRIPFETQLADGDFADVAEASQLLRRMMAISDQHIEQLKECLEELGGPEGGIQARALNGMRDDYTALALCAAGYTMLIAAANAVGESAVAAIAEALLENYAGLMMELGENLPTAVVQELAASGVDVNASTNSVSLRQVERAWQTQARQQPTAPSSRGTIGSTTPAFADTAS